MICIFLQRSPANPVADIVSLSCILTSAPGQQTLDMATMLWVNALLNAPHKKKYIYSFEFGQYQCDVTG
jgi:hypothetical protein